MKKLIVIAIFASMLSTACTYNWLVSNNFHGNDKTVKEFFTTAFQAGEIGQQQSTQYYNYTVRVCNIDDSGNLTQCMDTVIVENVIQDARYGLYQQH